MTSRTPVERACRVLSIVVLYLFPVLTLAILVGLGLWSLQSSSWWLQLAGRVVVGAGAIAFGWAVIAALRYRPTPTDGLRLGRDRHPELWRQIDDVAATVGVPAPDRILVTVEANATVAQVGRGAEAISELEIGLPLLAQYSVAELRAVLGHELGHIGGGDTAALARAGRARAFLHTMYEQSNPLIRWYFAAYLFAYGALDAAVSRAQEERADRAGLAVAPVEAAISALRGGELIGAWLSYYPEAVTKMDLARRRAPLLDGLTMALDAFADDAREWAAAAQADKGSLLDSHPPIAVRVAAYERLRSVAAAADPAHSKPAMSLVDRDWLVAHESRLHGLDLPPSSWDEVDERAAGAVVHDQALGLLEELANLDVVETASYAALFDYAAAARPKDLIETLGDPEAQQPAEVAGRVIAWVISSALLRANAGWASWPWNDEPQVRAATVDVDRLVEQFLTGPHGVAQVRAHLAEAGLDLSEIPGDGEAIPRLLGITTKMTGPWPGVADALYWSTGIAFVPAGRGLSRLVAGGDDEQRIDRLAETELPDLIADPDVRWVPRDSIVAARLAGTITTAFDLRLRDGSLLVVRETNSSVDTDPGGDALDEALRGKLRRADWDQATAAAGSGGGRGTVLRWAVRDTFAQIAMVASFLTLLLGILAYVEYDLYTVMSRPNELVQVDAVVEVPAEDSEVVILSVDHPRLPDELWADSSAFADAEALTAGQQVTMLVHPDDPDFYALEKGEQVSPGIYLALAAGAAGCLAAGAGSSLMAHKRYRSTYGRRPGQRTSDGH